MKLNLKTEKRKFFETIQRAVVYEEADENGICTCISCGKKGLIRDFDGGHGFSKGYNIKLARVRNNIHAQCHYCNRMLAGNQLRWFQGVQDRYGAEEYELLMLLDRASNGNMEALAELPEDLKESLSKKWTAEDYRKERLKWQAIIERNREKEQRL